MPSTHCRSSRWRKPSSRNKSTAYFRRNIGLMGPICHYIINADTLIWKSSLSWETQQGQTAFCLAKVRVARRRMMSIYFIYIISKPLLSFEFIELVVQFDGIVGDEFEFDVDVFELGHFLVEGVVEEVVDDEQVDLVELEDEFLLRVVLLAGVKLLEVVDALSSLGLELGLHFFGADFEVGGLGLAGLQGEDLDEAEEAGLVLAFLEVEVGLVGEELCFVVEDGVLDELVLVGENEFVPLVVADLEDVVGSPDSGAEEAVEVVCEGEEVGGVGLEELGLVEGAVAEDGEGAVGAVDEDVLVAEVEEARAEDGLLVLHHDLLDVVVGLLFGVLEDDDAVHVVLLLGELLLLRFLLVRGHLELRHLVVLQVDGLVPLLLAVAEVELLECLRLEEGVLVDLVPAHPFRWVVAQESPQQLLHLVRDRVLAGELHLARLDLGEVVVAFEGVVPEQQLVRDHAQREDVRLDPVLLPQQHLGGHRQRRPRERRGQLRERGQLLGQPHVRDLEARVHHRALVAVLQPLETLVVHRHHDVLQLDVPVDHEVRVQVREPVDHLLHHLHHVLLRHVKLEERAPHLLQVQLAVLQNYVDVLLSLH